MTTAETPRRCHRPLPGAGSLLLAAAAALLAVAVGLLLQIVRDTAAPARRGGPIAAARYDVDVSLLSSSRERWAGAPAPVHAAAGRLAATFSLSSMDGSLRAFLAASAQATSSRRGRAVALAKEWAFHALQRYLGWSRTDASGFVRKATLYVASADQFRELLAHGGEVAIEAEEGGGGEKQVSSLLDVGSGTGTETAKLSSALGVDPEQVVCIETSTFMRKKLKNRGFRVAGSLSEIDGNGAVSDDVAASPPFSAVALLNVLDRCDDPGGLLSAATNMMGPGGALVLAIVLPFSGRVFEGKRWHAWGKDRSRRPRSPLRMAPVAGAPKSFELGAAKFLEAIERLQPRLELVKWTRLPYVSSGNHKKTHYTIDMALLVLRLKGKEDGPSFGVLDHPSAAENSPMGSRGADARDVPTQCQTRRDDTIFSWLETTLMSNGYSGASWGDVLDAGAGVSSMCWLMHQDYNTITGVTAKSEGIDSYGHELKSIASPNVEIVLGNWQSEEFMKDRSFDIVVSDYLLGSTELHWKYGAETLLERLLQAVKPSGFLLIVGLEPYETTLNRTNTRDRFVLDIEAIGDSAATLAGHSTYRELPEEWVRWQIDRRPGFRVMSSRQFPMGLTAKSLRKQIAFASKMAMEIDDRGLQEAFAKRIKEMELEIEKFTVYNRARNYAIVVQRENTDSMQK